MKDKNKTKDQLIKELIKLRKRIAELETAEGRHTVIAGIPGITVQKEFRKKDSTRQVLEEYIRDWKVLIDAMPHPVSIHDTEFNIVLFNRADHLKDIKCHELFHNRDVPFENCPMKRALKSGKSEWSLIYEPTIKRNMLVHAVPVIVKGNIIGIIHSIIDMTEIEKREQYLLRNMDDKNA